MKMCQLSPDDRPREKMLAKGTQALSNADLLALVLRTGTGGKNVLEIARELLAENENSLTVVSTLSIDRLQRMPGIGPGKAAILCAIFEIVRRIMEEEPKRKGITLSDARMIFLYMEPRFSKLDHEEAWLVYLSRVCRLIATERLTSGSVTETTVDVRMIITKSLEKRASKIVLMHNHPEGNPRPGPKDIRFTMILKSALEPTGIKLVDHIIVSDEGFFSFSEEKVI